ncbi:PhzF family phenazine biosynthesis protein [Erwinia psidii]|uniref:PhzF family phenazine biosynthesis protein n=1 Tax=Erwinia psidii TaxID=69224 RepID=A0A3N6RXR5_9GAMM|nr:PhzF family phenazine biosynthesis protein [Erwinia psidii]MCX8959179.1 PhzF family phenazine biosynthesis protein [Erwinia psidii]MCX8962203.1 PhzF family phenazine biosynthesis protein [Erwinia psidii]MCX8966735.1 PhzF family phenazine biosynthesis protein [Erwinia psidii]RQM37187.1 PhzF family phenazine biosynthesis protein [Erwinia psidii]
MARLRAFKQVDVFTSSPLNGNPLAVVLDATGLSDEQMKAIARWTNLSETTFVLPADDPTADYRVRIFTPELELPFAGHPTLGTAHALLEAGMTPQHPGKIIQQCGHGLVSVRISEDNDLAFAAPEATLTEFRDMPLDSALNSDRWETRLPVMVADMGIRWLLVPMISADAVLAIQANAVELERLTRKAHVNGVMPFGPLHSGNEHYEVRGLFTEKGTLIEDPVTGSANACLARYLQAQGIKPEYRVRQGTALQRAGRLSVTSDADGVWIGGKTVTVIDGTVSI